MASSKVVSTTVILLYLSVSVLPWNKVNIPGGMASSKVIRTTVILLYLCYPDIKSLLGLINQFYFIISISQNSVQILLSRSWILFCIGRFQKHLKEGWVGS